MPNVSQWAFQIDIPTRFQIFEIFFPHKVWLLLHLNFDVDIKSIYYILHLHIFRWTIYWVLNALAESQDVYTFWHFWPPKILLIMDLNSCARQMWKKKRLQCQVKWSLLYQFHLHVIILLLLQTCRIWSSQPGQCKYLKHLLESDGKCREKKSQSDRK